MAFQSEIINSLKAPSVIRVADAGTTTISLNDLRANPTIETVTAANIKRVTWSTNGSISIVRNGNTALSLHNTGEMRFDEFGYAIANNNGSNIVITIASGGSLVMEVSKTATYSVDPYTGQAI
jgi:hypothetical protein